MWCMVCYNIRNGRIATQKRLLISKYTCIMYSEKLNLSLNFVLLEDENGDSSSSVWHF